MTKQQNLANTGFNIYFIVAAELTNVHVAISAEDFQDHIVTAAVTGKK